MSNKLPILIVDKKGIIGSLIAQKISSASQIVLVSMAIPEKNTNIFHVPFDKETPTVPDNTYSCTVFIDDKNSLTRESFEPFIKKAIEDKTNFIFVIFLANVPQALYKKALSYENSKVVLVGDVFDDEYAVEQNIVTDFINQIRQKERIQIKGDGMDVSFPVMLEDVVNSISKIIHEKNEKLIYLLPKNPITHLSLAHAFQKENPLIKIDFKTNKVSSKKDISLPDGYYYLGENLNLGDSIKRINLGTKNTPQASELVQEKRSYKKIFIFTAWIVIFLAILPFIISISFSAIGASELSVSKNELFAGSFTNAKSSSDKATFFLNIAKLSSNLMEKEALIVGQESRVTYISDQIGNLYLLSQATNYLIDAATKFTSSSSLDVFAEGTYSLKNALGIYRELETKNNLPSKVKAELTQFSPLIDILDTSTDLLPSILGYDAPKKYLVLFQNNMELRPGGGFIGSYGTLAVKNSKIDDFKVYDVYDADGQLKEHLEPPFPIRRYLPSAHFFLRDSNFYLNFSDNALSAQNFLLLEKKEKFDGVIALDVSFAKEVIYALGGVYVADYNVTVTGDNFFELADKYSRTNFFPGSTQKKDFLGAVFRAIQQDLTDKKISYVSLAKAFATGVQQKHIQLYFDDPSLQNISLLGGFSSGISDTRQNSQNTINDYMGIVEANLGVNKVNKDLARSISKSVLINEDGSVNSTITVAYKNDSNTQAYKNYLRFVTPLGSNFEGIKINGKQQDIVAAVSDPSIYEKKGFKPPKELELAKEDLSGKTVYGFLLSVPRESIKTISFEYKLPSSVDATALEINYSLIVFKQPGTDDYPFAVEVKYQKDLTLINSTLPTIQLPGKIEYEEQLEHDINLNVKFAPK